MTPPGVERRRLIPVRIPVGAGTGDYEGVIVIFDDQGVRGLGEAAAVAARGVSLKDLLSDLGRSRPQLAASRCALEVAALDLEGRRRGVSVAELLGGVRRRSVACSALVGSDSGPAMEAGFRTLKTKSLDAGGPQDRARLAGIRGSAPDVKLRIDFNTRTAQLQGLALYDLEFAEQPLPADSRAAEWQGMPVRVAADESLAQPLLALQLARAGIALAIKLATVGGPAAAVELAAAATGFITVGSSFETSIGIAAGLQVACALAAEPLACGLATAGLLEADLAWGLAQARGELVLPGVPGLGVDLDELALARYRLDR